MKKWTALTLGLVVVAALAFLKAGPGGTTAPRESELPPGPEAPPLLAEGEQKGKANLTSQNSQSLDPRIERLPDGRVLLAHAIVRSKELNQTRDPTRDLEIVAELFADYVRVFHEAPFGSENQEITAQLLGANPKKLVFLDPTSAALSTEGELLDRWASPYRFHPLTSAMIGVRSLGPDQSLWTEDDLELDYSEVEAQLQLSP